MTGGGAGGGGGSLPLLREDLCETEQSSFSVSLRARGSTEFSETYQQGSSFLRLSSSSFQLSGFFSGYGHLEITATNLSAPPDQTNEWVSDAYGALLMPKDAPFARHWVCFDRSSALRVRPDGAMAFDLRNLWVVEGCPGTPVPGEIHVCSGAFDEEGPCAFGIEGMIDGHGVGGILDSDDDIAYGGFFGPGTSGNWNTEGDANPTALGTHVITSGMIVDDHFGIYCIGEGSTYTVEKDASGYSTTHAVLRNFGKLDRHCSDTRGTEQWSLCWTP